MGSKRAGKTKKWEKEGKINYSYEPRVEDYFKGAFGLAGTKNSVNDHQREDLKITQIDFLDVRDPNVLNTCLKILECLKREKDTDIFAKTEEAALTHLARMTGIKLKIVRKRIREMLAEELITRIIDHHVGFKMTETGIKFLEEPAEWKSKGLEQFERICRALMREVRAAEMRSAAATVIQEFVSVEKKWKNVDIPTKEKMDDIKKTASYLRTRIPELNVSQPKCWVLRENYENKFSVYKGQVDEAKDRNDNALRLVRDFASIRENAMSIQDDIEFLENWKEKNKQVPLDSWQDSHVWDVLIRLDVLKDCFKGFSKEELEELESLRIELEKYEFMLEKISKPTHEWEPIEVHSVVVDPGRIAGAEGSLGSRPVKVARFVAKRRCRKCLKEE